MNVAFKKKWVGKPEPTAYPTSVEVQEWNLANGLCPKVVYPKGSYRGHICGREIKDTTLGLCGLHAGHVKRRQREQQERKDARTRNDNRVASAERLIKRFNKVLKVKDPYDSGVTVHYRMNPKTYVHTYTGGVVLDAETAEQVLALLEGK